MKWFFCMYVCVCVPVLKSVLCAQCFMCHEQFYWMPLCTSFHGIWTKLFLLNIFFRPLCSLLGSFVRWYLFFFCKSLPFVISMCVVLLAQFLLFADSRMSNESTLTDTNVHTVFYIISTCIQIRSVTPMSI